MEVTILALYSNRSDFLKPQFESFKKHLKDPFRFMVVNNAYYKVDKADEIEAISKEEDTGYIRVRHSGQVTDPSKIVRDTLNFLWKEFKKDTGILAIVDCDLFLIQDVSFSQLLAGCDMAFCPNYTAGKIWPWTGFMLFDMSKVKDDLSFNFYALDGKTYSDVGSGVYDYIKRYNPTIRTVPRKELLHDDWHVKDGHTLYTLGFPMPYSVDIVGDFSFHYKTSSNYATHCTPEYNHQKTNALDALLNL